MKNKGNSFTVNEQMEIFKSVMDGRSMPKTFEEFKDICEKVKLSIGPLKEKLNRTIFSISTNWHGFIQPTIYAYLCHKTEFQWKKDLFQFVVDSRALSISDVDWKEALRRWPYCTRKVLQHNLSNPYGNRGRQHLVTKIPLYKVIEPLLKTKGAEFGQAYFDRRRPLIEAFEKWRSENQMNCFSQ